MNHRLIDPHNIKHEQRRNDSNDLHAYGSALEAYVHGEDDLDLIIQPAKGDYIEHRRASSSDSWLCLTLANSLSVTSYSFSINGDESNSVLQRYGNRIYA